jgi:hypothetical protein
MVGDLVDKEVNMQVLFTEIWFDKKYIYATGKDVSTGEIRQIKISRTDDKDYWNSGDTIEFDRLFYAGAVELMCLLAENHKLEQTKCFTWS